MRPTGKLHLGHLVGALRNWTELQSDYDCMFFVADWHALTSEYGDPSQVMDYAYDNVADWIAAGLDPERSTIFAQSLVPEHAELYLLLSMVVPIPWLERVPTYKEQIEQLSDRDLSTLGFLGYPLLQCADVIIYRANYVPVGDDQVPHLELSREVVRRFHQFFGELFPEPQPLLTHFPRLPGLDNRKMSKSYGNAIDISDDEQTVHKKVMRMYTDPEAHPGRYSRHSRRQSGVHVPRRLQCRHRRSRRFKDTLSPGDGRRCRGQNQVGSGHQRGPRADARSEGGADERTWAATGDRAGRVEQGPGDRAAHDEGSARKQRGSRMDNGRDSYPDDFESILPDHPVRVANFEGPLDLLLHLIKKNELNIYDIPILLISEQYLEYLDLMQELDLDVAGEFLVMAATLIHIKSRMLVPRIETADDAEDEEDPRDLLVRRLLEHQKYRAAAELLHERETLRSAQWTRPDGRIEDISGVPFERELEVDMFSLLQAVSGGHGAFTRATQTRAAKRVDTDRNPDRAALGEAVRN